MPTESARLQVERPLRTKHEWSSDRCVTRFDHYCDFIDNNVGSKYAFLAKLREIEAPVPN